jgi:hypothetical protein
MASFDLADTVKTLIGERTRVQKELTKLDKAITVLKGLSGTNAVTSNGRGHKRRTLSVAARNKIAKAQRARWAKVRRERAGKA